MPEPFSRVFVQCADIVAAQYTVKNAYQPNVPIQFKISTLVFELVVSYGKIFRPLRLQLVPVAESELLVFPLTVHVQRRRPRLVEGPDKLGPFSASGGLDLGGEPVPRRKGDAPVHGAVGWIDGVVRDLLREPWPVPGVVNVQGTATETTQDVSKSAAARMSNSS